MIGHADMRADAGIADWIMHYLRETDHILLLIGLVALVVAAFFALRRSIKDDSK